MDCAQSWSFEAGAAQDVNDELAAVANLDFASRIATTFVTLANVYRLHIADCYISSSSVVVQKLSTV